MDNAAAGAEALKAGNYAEAVTKYTQALAISPASPDYYIKRSTAHQRSAPPNNNAALEDAEKAVVFARKRAKRELITQAQLRRAIALFMLERFADAQYVLSLVRKLDEKEKTLSIWEKKVGDKLNPLPDDHPKREVTVTEIPDETALETDEVKTNTPTVNFSTESEQSATASTAPKLEGVQTSRDKIRHEWFQSNDNVSFTLLVKGVPKDKASVKIKAHSLWISFPMPNDKDYEFTLKPLFAEINFSESTSTITNTKIEVVLRKQTKGIQWKSLEGDKATTVEGKGEAHEETDPIRRAIPSPSTTAQSSAPAYPTSAKGGPKNWDKIVDSYTKKPGSKKSKSNKTDDDASDSEPEGDDVGVDDLDDDGDPANAFFKKLYKDADPDTRRAMVKSYQESNGTALSTNWSEVGKGKVETSPPDGMVARKWED